LWKAVSGEVRVLDGRAGLARCRCQQLFNTIGNPAMDPRVGVFFVDFETGSLLQLTGARDRLGAGSGAQAPARND
jgi:hypothetical protein